MRYVNRKKANDEKGNPIYRYICPQCMRTVGFAKIGECPAIGEYCGHCGEELTLNPEDIIKDRETAE